MNNIKIKPLKTLKQVEADGHFEGTTVWQCMADILAIHNPLMLSTDLLRVCMYNDISPTVLYNSLKNLESLGYIKTEDV